MINYRKHAQNTYIIANVITRATILGAAHLASWALLKTLDTIQKHRMP